MSNAQAHKTERELQEATIASCILANDNLILVNYQNDYKLDEMLASNARTMLSSIIKIQKILHRAKQLVIPSVRSGCSTFDYENEFGHRMLARNFDFKEAPTFAIWTAPKNGYKSLSFADANFMLYGTKWQKPANKKKLTRVLSAPYVCTDGINEKGLAIAILELKGKVTKQSNGKPVSTPTIAVRAVLDTCATTEEAIAFFESHDMHDLLGSSYHYHISDATGSCALIEYVNNELHVLRPGKCEAFPNTWICAANFFVHPQGDNRKGVGWRRDRLMRAMYEKCSGHLPDEEAHDLLEECQLHYKHQLGWNVLTLWSALYNLENRTVKICVNGDWSQAYDLSLDAPLNYHAYEREAHVEPKPFKRLKKHK